MVNPVSKFWLFLPIAVDTFKHEIDRCAEHSNTEDTPAASWLPILLSDIGSQVKKT